MSNNLRKYLITTLSLVLMVVFSSMVLAADPPKTPAQTSNKPFQFKDDNKQLVPLTDEQKRQMKMRPGKQPLPQIKLDRCPDSVIQEFSISGPSCSVVHDPSRPLLSYRVSPPVGYKIKRVKIVHVTLTPGWTGGPERTVYDRSAAWSAMASGSGITDPGPVNASNVYGEYRLMVTSTCSGFTATTSRKFRYRYRLNLNFEIEPSVREIRHGSRWRYTVKVTQLISSVGAVKFIKFKAPPYTNSYQCMGRSSCEFSTVSGGWTTFSFDLDTKLSERGVTSISYEASLHHPGGRGSCGENVVRTARLIAYTTPSPSPEPSPTPSPEPAAARWWDLRCNCTVGGTDVRNFVVSSRACMERSEGAGWMCGTTVRNNAEALLRAAGRLEVHAEVVCSFRSVQEHTADRGSCRSGANDNFRIE